MTRSLYCEPDITKVDPQWATFIRELARYKRGDAIEWRTHEEIAAVLAGVVQELPGKHLAYSPCGERFVFCSVGARLKLDRRQGTWGGSPSFPYYVLRPVSLRCVVFPKSPEWSYLELELGRLSPRRAGAEPPPAELYCLTVRGCGNENRFRKVVCRKGAFDVRFHGGRIVIFSNNSLYDVMRLAGDGRHEQMTSKEFERFIRRAVDRGQAKTRKRLVRVLRKNWFVTSAESPPLSRAHRGRR